MLFNLLDAGYPKHVGFGEASLDAIIGFMVVFFGIIFLVFVVWLVGKIFSVLENKKDKKNKAKQEPVMIPSTETVQEDGISEETVAVIMAALAAYYQTNQPKCEFTVKRIKRI